MCEYGVWPTSRPFNGQTVPGRSWEMSRLANYFDYQLTTQPNPLFLSFPPPGPVPHQAAHSDLKNIAHEAWQSLGGEPDIMEISLNRIYPAHQTTSYTPSQLQQSI